MRTMGMSRSVLFVLVVLLFGGLSGVARAQTGSENWEFNLTPFLWGTGIDGTLAMGSREVPIEVSAKDLFKSLDFGFMANFEARNGSWVVTVEPSYVDLGKETDPIQIPTTPPIDLGRGKVDIKQWIVEGSVAYRVTPSFEVLGGVRGYHVSSRAEGPLGRVAEGSAGWVDPIVGARFRRAFAEKWILGLRGDIGGFGAGTDFAWFFNAVGGYRFNQTFALVFGYRVWDFDRESDGELPEIDVTLAGFGGGISIHF